MLTGDNGRGEISNSNHCAELSHPSVTVDMVLFLSAYWSVIRKREGGNGPAKKALSVS